MMKTVRRFKTRRCAALSAFVVSGLLALAVPFGVAQAHCGHWYPCPYGSCYDVCTKEN